MKYQSDASSTLKVMLHRRFATTIFSATQRCNMVVTLIGTLRSEDGDGRENFAEKVNSCSLTSFNLHRDYCKSLTFSNVGEPS